MQQCSVRKELFGYEIRAEVTKLPEDIHILLTGGVLPHVGAVSIYKEGEAVNSLQLPKHKDGIIGNRWAKEVSKIFSLQVTVVCGIHYNSVTKEMIEKIVELSDEMLEEVIKNLKQF